MDIEGLKVKIQELSDRGPDPEDCLEDSEDFPEPLHAQLRHVLPRLDLQEYGDGKGEAWLECRNCGCNNLHQFQTDIYERPDPDEHDVPVQFHVRTTTPMEEEGGRHMVDGDMAGCPSPRRQGLSIRLRCEQCVAITVLHVFQHKGLTVMTSDVLEDDVP